MVGAKKKPDSMLNEFRESKKKIEATMARLEKRISDLECKTKGLRTEIEKLKESHTWGQGVRNRFIETTRRDKLGVSETEINNTIINHVDWLVHNGEAWADALLWKDEIRTDAWTCKAIYGYTYNEVIDLIISMISMRGTIITDDAIKESKMKTLDSLILDCVNGYKALENDVEKRDAFAKNTQLRLKVKIIDVEL